MLMYVSNTLTAYWKVCLPIHKPVLHRERIFLVVLQAAAIVCNEFCPKSYHVTARAAKFPIL